MKRVLLASSDRKELEAFNASLQQSPATITRVTDSLAQAIPLLFEDNYDLLILGLSDPDLLYVKHLAHFQMPKVVLGSASQLELISHQPLSVFLTRPMNSLLLEQTVFLCLEYRAAVHKLSAMEQKLERAKLIERAKCKLIYTMEFNEEQAHRYIEKQSMDSGLPKYLIAKRILDNAS